MTGRRRIQEGRNLEGSTWLGLEFSPILIIPLRLGFLLDLRFGSGFGLSPWNFDSIRGGKELTEVDTVDCKQLLRGAESLFPMSLAHYNCGSLWEHENNAILM